MFFKCDNCGGNVVYDPYSGKMHCPHCESENSQKMVHNTGDMKQCINCGAPMDSEIREFTSACKCPNCGMYTILEPRVDGEFKPDLILPFKISKNGAVEILKKEFGNRKFTPLSFLSNASIDKMEGAYVPFFLYDYHVIGSYHGKCSKTRVWEEGDRRYKEVSYFAVDREVEADYANVPADASLERNNRAMDLLEPYKYADLHDFDPKYMSGFMGELFSEKADQTEDRAKAKVFNSMDSIVRSSLSQYDTVYAGSNIDSQLKGYKYALLPVWEYIFRYRGNNYRFYVNGQTGKVIGKTPVDRSLVLAYGGTVFALLAIVGEFIVHFCSLL
ncbi:MAG: hypothetical protein K5662_02700 [Lachnospiraceae bacterium]|nr:hypothetical protein [Lachnospiraceae bacterium]